MAIAEKEQEKIWFAREVFNLFVKCFTNLKLYPHDHAHCRSAVDDFSKRVRSYVQMHDIMRIGVTQDALTVDNEPVYQAEGRNENLAFRLYIDGLRELSISRGVTHEEAERLAQIFYKVIVDPQADSTILLWEGDFKNVDHVAINSLSEAWESPDYFSSDQLDLLKDMNRNVEQIVEQLSSPERGGYQFELTDGAAELENAHAVDADGVEARDEDEGDIFAMDEEALQSLRTDLAAWGPDRLLKAVVEHSLDGLALAPTDLGVDNVGWLLQEALELAMRSQDLELLGDLLVRYDGELALTEEDDAEEVFKGIFAWLNREENLERLVKMAKGGALGGPKAFCRILSLIGEGGLLAAISTYVDTENKELKEALLNFMMENAHLNPLAFGALLRPDIEDETAKSALFVINKKIRGDALSELLQIARQHPKPEIKQYADHLWRANTDDGRMAQHVDALKADGRNDRIRALQAVVGAKHRDAIERIKEVVGDGDFLQKDAHERKAYLDALAYLAGTASVAFLEQQTKRSTMLFNRKAAKELREQALETLASLKSGSLAKKKPI